MEKFYSSNIEQGPLYNKYTSQQETNEPPFWMTVLDDIYYRLFDKYEAK